VTTATFELDGASALTMAWVRTLLMKCSAYARQAKERCPVGKPDERILADVAAASRGDGEAYARIIGRYQNTIARRMTRFTRDPAAVEELVHDVFVEAYFSLSRYRGDAPLEHWLARIATRVGYRYWTRRRQENERTVSLEVRIHDPAAPADETDDAADEVAVLLEKLPPRDRLVLTLLYIESHTVAEAADLAGWSQTMVKVQAYRARQKLRKLMNASPAFDTPEGQSDG
jgi:RNA polymerase sigma-70 factor, ECF subfamily